MRAVMPTSVPWAFLLVGIVTMQMPEQGLAMLEKEPLDIDVRSESVHSKELLHDISQPAERRAGADVIEGLLTSSAHTSSAHKDHSGGQVTKIQTDAPLDYVDHLLSQQWLDTASIRWPATSAADANEASEGAATANFLMADGKGKVANGTANESLGVERADIEENPDGTVFLATLENPAPEEIQKTWRGRVVDILAVLVVASGLFVALLPAGQMALAAVRLHHKANGAAYEDLADADADTSGASPVPPEWMQGVDPQYNLFSIQERLFEQATKTPERIAAVDAFGKQLSYDELVKRASMVAASLEQQGVKPDDLVGMFFPKSCGMLVGMAGILTSGAAYVPFALDVPRARLESMLKDGNIRVVVVAASFADEAKEKLGDLARVVVVDSNIAVSGEIRRPVRGKFAYTSFTSGSTGVPKGVLLSQRAVLTCVVQWPDIVGINQDSVSMWSTTYTFDAGVTEYWPFLLVGAKLVLPPPNALKDFSVCHKVIESHQISHCQFVPSVLTLFLHKYELPSSVRSIALGGEGFPLPLCEAIFARSQRADIKVLNIYAPTEVGVWVMHREVKRSESLDGFAVVPVGKPLPHREVVVLDKNGALAPIGVRGEILMGGVGLAEGYVNDQEKTAKAFADGIRAGLKLPPFNEFGLGPETRMYRTGDFGRWLPNGDLEYLGRIDCQVKINGLRIELGEIENAIKSVGDSVKDAVVVAVGNVLVAFSESTASTADLQKACRSKLPEYMVPKIYMKIDRENDWPRTSSLKVDRKVLVERANTHIESGPSKEIDIGIGDAQSAEEAGVDSLGMVRMAMQVEVEEEALCLNMKAMASFLLHFHHLWLGGWFQKEKGALWKSEDPLLSKYFHLADIADPLFLIAIGLSDRHSGNKPSLRDIGLGVIWFEYLWVFPFGVRAIAEYLGLNFGVGVGWFLLTLLFGRITLHTLTLLRVPPSLQVTWTLAVFVLVSLIGAEPTYDTSSLTDEETMFLEFEWPTLGDKPLGVFCVHHLCNPGLPKGGFVETLGKIFINGGWQSIGSGHEFGYFAVYTKMFLMVAQYLFSFHYGNDVMRFVRWCHTKLSDLLGSNAALNHARIFLVVATCLYWCPSQSLEEVKHTKRLFNWLNFSRVFETLGAVGMMVALYKCGTVWKQTGSTILGYFLVGYHIPMAVFYSSAIFKLCMEFDHWLLAYTLQMAIAACYVIGWMSTISVGITYIITGQFRVLIMCGRKLSALCKQ